MRLVIGCMGIFKRMSRTLTEVGLTLRMTLFRDEAAQVSHYPVDLRVWAPDSGDLVFTPIEWI